jgi:hypothetical protein
MSDEVTLFIRDEPFFQGIGTDPLSGKQFPYVEIRLWVGLTEPTANHPPSKSTALSFVLDTGADYALVSRDHLDACGMPRSGLFGGFVTLTLADGTLTEGEKCNVTLWLFSNRSNSPPHQLDPNGKGVVLWPGSSPLVRPLIGMNPLLGAGVRIELNFLTQKFSLWVRAPQNHLRPKKKKRAAKYEPST